MHKVHCTTGNLESCFYLDNVKNECVEHLANILANNLSFEETNTRPLIKSIVNTEAPGTPLFEYLGSEVISEDENRYRQSLFNESILTGAVHNFKDKTTTIYKFKVVNR